MDEQNNYYKHFLRLVEECETEILKSDFHSQEGIQSRVDEFVDENGKMDLYATMNYILHENRNFSVMLLAKTLEKLTEKGYLNIIND